MDSVIMIAASAIPSIISGTVLYLVNKQGRKSEKMEALRVSESILVFENIDAVGTLADRAARCIKGEKVNGELDAAMEYRTCKKHELEKHLYEVNAEMKKG